MKLLVKTLTGGKFEVQAEESNTVAQVKVFIEAVKSDLPAASMKLIKSGKVLKDEDVLSEIGIKENDFLVVMITKTKKPAAAPTTPADATTPTTAPAAPKPPAPSAATTPAAAAAAAVPAAPAATTTTTTTNAAPAAPSSDFPPEAVSNLTAMGFPEEEVKHCLRAAQGNPDLAVEFLTNGIPEAVSAAMVSGGAVRSSAASSAGGGQPLQELRNHPQLNELRRLVQSNPQMLQNVLGVIGRQQPELLQEINANQALFLQIMNEPITEASSPGTSSAQPSASGSAAREAAESAAAGLGGIGNPAQMAQMINSMSPDELEQMAQMMGLSPDQLRATAQMIGQMPPEQLQQFMMQAMGGGMPPGMGGGPQVLRLTDEEMAAVDRLTEMGFDRAEAAQAFLACDKNEALAANLLMDSMGDNDGGFFGGGNGGNDNDNNDGGDDDEDMYD